MLVQLVRIHACHAWGHGFESRTHRNNYQNGTLTEWLGSGLQNRVQQFESAGYLTRATKFFSCSFFYFKLTFSAPKRTPYNPEDIPILSRRFNKKKSEGIPISYRMYTLLKISLNHLKKRHLKKCYALLFLRSIFF